VSLAIANTALCELDLVATQRFAVTYATVSLRGLVQTCGRRWRIAMMDRMMRRPGFSKWCQCTRLLLGWTAGTPENWRNLYASGATPLQAARRTVFGEEATGTD
jgi:hypothetical protein